MMKEIQVSSGMKVSIIFSFLVLLFLCAQFKIHANESPPQWKVRQQRMFSFFEQKSSFKNWQKITMTVEGLKRKVLWKADEKPWKNGAIIVLHGGGGTYSNFAAGMPLGQPMVDFADLALSKGFAIFSPDSTNGVVTGINGYQAGKRWDCMEREDRKNIDLPFIKELLDKTIPKLRPPNSSKNIYITGISNGGYMTILSATHFPDKIKAFAPVSCGDPYGTHIQCDVNPEKRPNAPGEFKDLETNIMISKKGAANSSSYPNEKSWPSSGTNKKPPFKQFQHKGDLLVDFSNMLKANKQLKAHGYEDDGAFVLDGTNRKLRFHFWQKEYNQPLIDFFLKYSND